MILGTSTTFARDLESLCPGYGLTYRVSPIFRREEANSHIALLEQERDRTDLVIIATCFSSTGGAGGTLRVSYHAEVPDQAKPSNIKDTPLGNIARYLCSEGLFGSEKAGCDQSFAFCEQGYCARLNLFDVPFAVKSSGEGSSMTDRKTRNLVDLLRLFSL